MMPAGPSVMMPPGPSVILLPGPSAAIPALTPQREQFLEYDVSELIYGVGQTDKKKLGLITSLPLQGLGAAPAPQKAPK